MLPKHSSETNVIIPIPGPTKVSGVRVYTPAPELLANGESVFYSRRRDGPYYRWLLEETSGRWRAARVTEPGLISHSLSLATWKNVPKALMTRLGEHYLE